MLGCNFRLAAEHPEADRSEMDRLSRSAALDNVADNLTRMPIVVTARIGRTLGVWDPVGTVQAVSRGQLVRAWPIALWVASFWVLAPMAIVGGAAARRKGTWLLPLLAPGVAVVVVVLVVFGEPRYHALADPSLLVLGAFGAVFPVRRTGLGRDLT